MRGAGELANQITDAHKNRTDIDRRQVAVLTRHVPDRGAVGRQMEAGDVGGRDVDRRGRREHDEEVHAEGVPVDTAQVGDTHLHIALADAQAEAVAELQAEAVGESAFQRDLVRIAFALPQEGTAIWTDSLLVLASAPNKRTAHEFINYTLRPEVAAGIARATGYGSPNEAAQALLERPVPYPTQDDLVRLEYQLDLGEATGAWDRIWTEVKAA